MAPVLYGNCQAGWAITILVLLDQAGWHLSKRLVIPANITPVPLPAKATRRGSPTLIATRRPVFDWRRRTVMPS